MKQGLKNPFSQSLSSKIYILWGVLILENILKLVNELKETSGKLNKASILDREINNEQFKRFIKSVLCPMKIYGIQDKKLNKYLSKTDGKTEFNNMFEVFSYLEENSTGRDIDAERVAAFIDSQPEEYKGFLVESFCKKLRMGIDSTVNKSWSKGFLSKFDVMLAKDFYKELHKVEGKEFVLTEKLDGQRAVFIHKDGRVKVFSRSGKSIMGLTEIENEISRLPENVYDGELLIKNEHLYKDRNVLQETLKITRKDGEKSGLNFWIFDALNNDEFQNGQSKSKFIERKVNLAYQMSRIDTSPFNHIQMLPVLYQGKDMTVIPELLSKLEDEGKEGLMLNLDKPYQCKRSDVLLKIKSMKSMDIKIIGFEEGDGKYKGMLGNLVLDYKGYELRSGSGLNDSDREEIWNNQERYLGKIVEIQYFRESTNDKGGLSVSFPVFLGFRDDKDEPSYH